jgi:hypothetical protein
MISQAVSSFIITEVKPSLKAARKFVPSEKTKHIKVAKIKASKIRFVINMYKIKKNAGIKEKSPMSTLPSTKTRSGKNNVISKVHPTTKNAVSKNLNKVFFGSDFFSKILPSGSNGVSKMKNIYI